MSRPGTRLKVSGPLKHAGSGCFIPVGEVDLDPSKRQEVVVSARALACRTAIFLSLGVLTHLPAEAQPAPAGEVSVGERVRLTLLPTKESLVATLVATGDDRITVQPVSSPEKKEIDWADLGRLQVSRGKRGHTLKGLLAGAAAWAATVGLVAAFDTLDESGLGEPLVIGGYLATGALVGSLVRTESWSDVALPAAGHVASRSRPGFRVQLAVGF
jgi:hypothetical protein